MAAAPDGNDDITEEARLMVARVRAAVTGVPLGGDLATLAVDALRAPGRDMTPEEIRHLAADAMDQANQISYLLGKLAGILDDEHQEQ